MPTANAFNNELAATRRQRVLMEAQGYYVETCALSASLVASGTTGGTAYGMAIPLLAGDVVTNLSARVAVAGVGMTLAKLGLYSKTGTLLAASADAASSFNSTGIKTLPVALVAGQPFTVTADDMYYAAFVATTATTMPQMLRGCGSLAAAATAGGVGSGSAFQVTQTGQTDLPSPATFAAATSGLSIWIGVS